MTERPIDKAAEDLRRAGEAAERTETDGEVTVRVAYQKGKQKHHKVITERRIEAN